MKLPIWLAVWLAATVVLVLIVLASSPAKDLDNNLVIAFQVSVTLFIVLGGIRLLGAIFRGESIGRDRNQDRDRDQDKDRDWDKFTRR
jgi:hypothetical protein